MAEPMSWLTLEKGMRVVGADGTEVGTVTDVIADLQKGIFSGLSISSGLLSDIRFVPADLIANMSEDAIELTITAAEADAKLESQS
jgi:uncharacterized protein YrrD